ncbi:glycosyl hydrolase family 95 catalytic domain-containing protein [Agriterribacter humi]|uniref:glycosyl hydrolase family 95 catalytic domain-containing protein n=1 Tax=Agriterribacter humi TaxID=1104781 RepID=UPI00126478B0|nr:glycoside hydrolase N-terminal domain-containing protein [Agriterribacter humi]
MNKIVSCTLTLLLPLFLLAQPARQHDLYFKQLATVWDEAIPLGNGTVGALIWQKGDHLRFSLDRSDIWDMRPLKGLHRKEFSYQWIEEQINKKDYKPVQEYFDAPYDREPAPSKIPAGALEFKIPADTKVKSVRLMLANALCEVQWENGMILKTFVHATEPVGWFRFENFSEDFIPRLIAPPYQSDIKEGGEVNSLVGDDLARLGYKQGKIQQQGNSITYRQEGWGGFTYEITVQWKKINAATIEGVWSVSSQYPNKKINPAASVVVNNSIHKGFKQNYTAHLTWWKSFWSKSAIHVPDTLLEKQWYLEQYKFGSAARRGAPPISLQAVWTADNGRIPPWKGDFHHDLNTQLSYWPAYSSNHLEEALGYIDHLDENKPNYKRYTKLFFGKEGLAVPGVTTLDGTEMGGWTQYSLSPTVSSWLAHHYYLQWKYSMDKSFLKNSAYPWLKETCTFLESITVKDEKGLRKLPLSSSPEINDNRIDAWFHQNTNYDLALMKFSFTAAAEMARALGLTKEATRWEKILSEFGDYSITANDELMFAPTLPYNQSHRHFSHLMAIHPLSLIKWEDGEKAQSIIKNTIALLEKIGPDYWCGYSYSWLGNIMARAKDGEGAVKTLQIFAKAFCLPNSFHVNGDQTKSGYSKFTYRPFTLEGNFAFAAGLQEMLLQSYAGFIEIMPAVPQAWKDISFKQLRAEGAFLVDARKENGKIREIKIVAEKGGKTRLKLPFEQWKIVSAKGITTGKAVNGFIELTCKAGGVIILKNDSE